MAVVVARIAAGTPVRVDELCTRCWCSSVWDVPMLLLGDAGVSQIGVCRICAGCRVRLP